jgi:leucine dehydrogenase
VTGIYGGSGDPSPVTAFGTYRGIKAAAKAKYGDDSLEGKTIAVQGLGHVGSYLCAMLHDEGAKLVVTDIDKDRVAHAKDEFGAKTVAPDEIYEQKADVFAPCALGAVVNDQTLPKLTFDIIAGAANNVLAEPRHGDELHRKGILYAPDYVINAGGLINVYGELNGWSAERAKRKAQEIYDTILRVFSIASRDGVPSFEAADRLAEERIRSVAALKDMWVAGDR